MLAIIGPSSSGKSTIEKIIRNQYGYNKVVSLTTRPMREGEVDGEDYYFVTHERYKEIEDRGLLAESVTNYGNKYGIYKKDCTNDKVVVVAPEGFYQLLAKKDLKITSFFIDASWETRIRRMKSRGDKPEYIQERIEKDDAMFNPVKDKVDYIVHNEFDGEKELMNVVHFILYHYAK